MISLLLSIVLLSPTGSGTARRPFSTSCTSGGTMRRPFPTSCTAGGTARRPFPTQPDNTLSSKERRQGWILLFDGKTLDGWMTSSRTPSRVPVEDGCIQPHGAGGYMMVHEKMWENFILSLDFKISKGCNSGVFIRTKSLDPPPGRDVGWNGIEIQVLDSPTAGYYDTGAIYDLSKPTKQTMKPVGEWNHMVITSKGPIIEVELNGEKVNRVNLDEFTLPNRRPDGTEHKFDIAYKDHPRRGYIGLQDHGSPCWYKNIKIKPLRG